MHQSKTNVASHFRQGSYKYKKGTTSVIKTEVKKLQFDVVKSSTSTSQEAMDTA